MKRKDYKNGATVTHEKLFPSGMYLVQLRNPAGELVDKIRCDDYRDSLAYYKCFSGQARNMKGL